MSLHLNQQCQRTTDRIRRTTIIPQPSPGNPSSVYRGDQTKTPLPQKQRPRPVKPHIWRHPDSVKRKIPLFFAACEIFSDRPIFRGFGRTTSPTSVPRYIFSIGRKGGIGRASPAITPYLRGFQPRFSGVFRDSRRFARGDSPSPRFSRRKTGSMSSPYFTMPSRRME